jgi:hypothetical protein
MGRNWCSHGLANANDFVALAGALSHAGPRKRTAAENLVEAKLSAKAIPEPTPGRSSSP